MATLVTTPGPTGRVAVLGALWLALRDLRHRARRFAVAVVGTGVIFALLLVMLGLVRQFRLEPELAVAHFGATHWVVPAGTTSPFTSASVVDTTAGDTIAVEGAQAPVVVARSIAHTATGSLPVMLIGHGASSLGAPQVARGRLASSPDEVAVSHELGLTIGADLTLGSKVHRVVGLVDDATVLAGIPMVFLPADAVRTLVHGSRDVTSAFLSDGTVDGAPTGMHTVTTDEVVADLRAPLEAAVATVYMIGALLAVVATLILSAVVYLSALDRTRDVAVLRATGTSGRVLATGVAGQAVLLALVAAVLAIALEGMIGPMFPVRVRVAASDRLLLPAGAMVVAMIASYAAIRRTLQVDPASAFAGPGG